MDPIRFRDRPDRAAGNTRRHNTGGDIMGDHASGTDDRAAADCNTAAHHGVGTNPDIVLQPDGLGCADPLGPLHRIKGMSGTAQAYPGAIKAPAPM